MCFLAVKYVILGAEFYLVSFGGVRIMSKNLRGSIMVLIAGMCWGISGISGQYLLSHGVNINLLTSVRLLTSGVILTLIAICTQKDNFFMGFGNFQNTFDNFFADMCNFGSSQ